MAFVLEKLSEEEQQKCNDASNTINWHPDNTWAIDRERDIWLRKYERLKEQYGGPEIWTYWDFFWKGHYLMFITRGLPSGKEDDKVLHIHWLTAKILDINTKREYKWKIKTTEVIKINFPKELEQYKTEILNDFKDALTIACYGNYNLVDPGWRISLEYNGKIIQTEDKWTSTFVREWLSTAERQKYDSVVSSNGWLDNPQDQKPEWEIDDKSKPNLRETDRSRNIRTVEKKRDIWLRRYFGSIIEANKNTALTWLNYWDFFWRGHYLMFVTKQMPKTKKDDTVNHIYYLDIKVLSIDTKRELEIETESDTKISFPKELKQHETEIIKDFYDALCVSGNSNLKPQPTYHIELEYEGEII